MSKIPKPKGQKFWGTQARSRWQACACWVNPGRRSKQPVSREWRLRTNGIQQVKDILDQILFISNLEDSHIYGTRLDSKWSSRNPRCLVCNDFSCTRGCYEEHLQGFPCCSGTGGQRGVLPISRLCRSSVGWPWRIHPNDQGDELDTSLQMYRLIWAACNFLDGQLNQPTNQRTCGFLWLNDSGGLRRSLGRQVLLYLCHRQLSCESLGIHILFASDFLFSRFSMISLQCQFNMMISKKIIWSSWFICWVNETF